MQISSSNVTFGATEARNCSVLSSLEPWNRFPPAAGGKKRAKECTIATTLRRRPCSLYKRWSLHTVPLAHGESANATVYNRTQTPARILLAHASRADATRRVYQSETASRIEVSIAFLLLLAKCGRCANHIITVFVKNCFACCVKWALFLY